MRWDNVFVAGTGSYLPSTVETVDDAVAAGRYKDQDRDVRGFRAVRVAAQDEPGPVLAARAGRVALGRSGLDATDIALVLHAYWGHQGKDAWSPASYVERYAVNSGAPAYEIRQGCNGGLSALELAASYIAARPDAPAALITTGDAFHLPFLDRWRTDEQMVYGDGGGALVLSAHGGLARVLATASVGDGELEKLERGQGPWSRAPFEDGTRLDLGARKREHLLSGDEEFSFEDVLARLRKGSSAAVAKALTDSGTELPDVRWCVHTTFPEPIAQNAVYGPLGFSRDATSYDWSLDYGQLGAGDQIIGLDHLLELGLPEVGDRLLAYGVGAGNVWTVAILEFTEDWPRYRERYAQTPSPTV